MGQSFRLAAPRAKMSLRWGYRLGEMLFDGSAKALVPLLAVPLGPHNTVCVSKAGPSPIGQSQSDRCVAHMAAGDSHEIWIGKRSKRKADGEMLAGSRQRHKRAKAKDGDHERDIIPPITFSNLSSIEDVICLGLASRYFWAIGRDYVHDYYTSFLGRWAGRNIVCVGEDVKPGDFPPGLFSAEEVDELCQRTTDIPYDDEYPDDVAFPAVPFTLYHFTFPSISNMEGECDLKTESQLIYFQCRDEGRRSDKPKDPAFELAYSDICVTESTYFPEFVRSEAIALKPEFIHGPSIDVLGFGEVVMSRICWSTSSYVSMYDTSNISRGVWAGHCFDITTLARHGDETRGAEWKDVSEEVASEIAGIWEAEYGPDWRETVCNVWYQT
ncbi:hypothetical protein C7999DRAFT_45039 [Corynascus novoguineensis]|uniref:Uncharacterized protein n=1 Tax=Corynascus novoguineensis TaxID=1126955 RepID=A0AAN7HF90_9PEZI|nr:hypothetical protein C7999DRAFT_45039 [Corynascus novoguineensis]